MATLTGRITDVTGRAPDSISSITVKAPSARIGGGTDVIVSSPAEVTFDRTTGDITISGLHVGLSWLYLEGEGWSDSIPLAAAEGMVTLVEAIANAAGTPGLVDYIELLVNLQARIDDMAQGSIDSALATKADKTYVDAQDQALGYVKSALVAGSTVNTLHGDSAVGFYSVRSGVLGLPLDTNGHLWVSHNGVSSSTLQEFQPAHFADNQIYRRKRVAGVWRAWEATPTGSALQTKFDTKLDKAAQWNRGFLGGTSADTLIGKESQGLYSAPGYNTGTPVELPGWVEVRYEQAAGRTMQTFISSSPIELAEYRRFYSGGAWTEWRIVSYQGRTVSSGSFDEVVYPATYRVGNAYLPGRPVDGLGVLEVLPASTAQADIIQRFTELGSPTATWVRSSIGGSWSGWEQSSVSEENLTETVNAAITEKADKTAVEEADAALSRRIDAKPSGEDVSAAIRTLLATDQAGVGQVPVWNGTGFTWTALPGPATRPDEDAGIYTDTYTDTY